MSQVSIDFHKLKFDLQQRIMERATARLPPRVEIEAGCTATSTGDLHIDMTFTVPVERGACYVVTNADLEAALVEVIADLQNDILIRDDSKWNHTV